MKLLIFLAAITFSISADIYIYESDHNGFNTRSFFYDNGHEVVAFGGQFTPQLAQDAISFLRKKTQNPITHLVITHPNPDKFNGATVFQQHGARVISSTKTADSLPEVHNYKKYYFVHIAKMFTEETYPVMPIVDFTFDDKFTLQLKTGKEIVLQELHKPGVSSNQTVAYIPSENAIMVGDLIHHQAHAWLEGGIINGEAQATISSWIGLLQTLAKQFSPETIVYGGRGNKASLKVATDQQIKYLQKSLKLTRDYIKALGNKKSEIKGKNAHVHHTKIMHIFGNEFPGYKFEYMVKFGIYGLINKLVK